MTCPFGLRRLVAIVSLVAWQPALADSDFFIGVGGGLTRLETANFVQDSGFSDTLATDEMARSGEFSDDSFGWRVFAAWMYSRNFGLAARYVDTGDAEADWRGTVSNTDPMVPIQNVDFSGEMSMDGYAIYAVQTIPVNDKWEWSLMIGWTDQDLEFEYKWTG